MMRNKPASSMQKTYDECYLICSTAVFFESQNNEAEALRSWKSALDQIHYHNAYRMSSSYVPRSETERALFDSLKQMELQCKERVDLLEALKQSRSEASKDGPENSSKVKKDKGKVNPSSSQPGTWLGGETVPPVQYSDIPSAQLLPARPKPSPRPSTHSVSDQIRNDPKAQISSLSNAPKLAAPVQHASRSPSPDHGRKPLRKTLRPEGRALKTSRPSSVTSGRPAPMKAAGLAWDTHPRSNSLQQSKPDHDPTIEARLSATAARRSLDHSPANHLLSNEAASTSYVQMPDPMDFIPNTNWRDTSIHSSRPLYDESVEKTSFEPKLAPAPTMRSDANKPPPPPPHTTPLNAVTSKIEPPPARLPKPPQLSYRKEYLPTVAPVSSAEAKTILEKAYQEDRPKQPPSPGLNRKPVPKPPVPRARGVRSSANGNTNSDSDDARVSTARGRRPPTDRQDSVDLTPPSTDADSLEDTDSLKNEWDKRVEKLMKNLPKGIDELAAKNILNEIVVKGDEVHWSDVAGLESAKKALKEAVVYPFLRPDLFMGLREPARGMLLFGPPGTGKTMLARAVATESKSTFFAISASSLTSKWHGESEKLVRALFGLAKALAPSIIFVDEIDSLLNSRGGGSEHEASRRSKTEFLIQWSDLQRAAAGKEVGVGDASRVLVLAATNCPWDIDDAARRRFVRRQYIPLPEPETRETQLRTLLAAQRHDLSERDIKRLVRLTDGYSGSDITALAKDAAMGPLRNLGEALLYTPMDQIRPIKMSDFESSLESIRPSVSKKGLEEFEEWAREYGERAG